MRPRRAGAVVAIVAAAAMALTGCTLLAPLFGGGSHAAFMAVRSGLERMLPGRLVGVSSFVAHAFARGLMTFPASAAAKAGVEAFAKAFAVDIAGSGATVNCVAPGFIETEMTAKMPLGTREVGSRLNSLQQGGLPVDVAETIAWLSQPTSAGVNGQTVRVCGQSLLGA